MRYIHVLKMYNDTKGMTELCKARKEMYKARTGYLRMMWRWTKRIGLAALVVSYVQNMNMWQSLAVDLMWAGLKFKVLTFFN